jgi:hypothetical protein
MSRQPRRLIPLLLAGLFLQDPGLQPPPERRACCNQSGAAWRITLVEGAKPRVGAMVFLDKFSGKELKVLRKSGDSLTLPPGSSYVYSFSTINHYCYQDFMLLDPRGHYVEFVASVPYLANPEVVLDRSGQGLGSPLNEASGRATTRAIEAALRVDRGGLTIVQDFIGLDGRQGP